MISGTPTVFGLRTGTWDAYVYVVFGAPTYPGRADAAHEGRRAARNHLSKLLLILLRRFQRVMETSGTESNSPESHWPRIVGNFP